MLNMNINPDTKFEGVFITALGKEKLLSNIISFKETLNGREFSERESAYLQFSEILLNSPLLEEVENIDLHDGIL